MDTRLVTWAGKINWAKRNPLSARDSFLENKPRLQALGLRGYESGPGTTWNQVQHKAAHKLSDAFLSSCIISKIKYFLVRNNPSIWLLVREEATGFLLGKTWLLCKPTQRKHIQQNQDRYLFSNHNCWFLLSCWFLFRAIYINTGVLTYIICCHNNNTLYLQNILKWR